MIRISKFRDVFRFNQLYRTLDFAVVLSTAFALSDTGGSPSCKVAAAEATFSPFHIHCSDTGTNTAILNEDLVNVGLRGRHQS